MEEIIKIFRGKKINRMIQQDFHLRVKKGFYIKWNVGIGYIKNNWIKKENHLF